MLKELTNEHTTCSKGSKRNSLFNESGEFVVSNRRYTGLKLIPYIGCKAGFTHIFDEILPQNIDGCIYDVFGGGGSFAFYACSRYGSHRVTYNDNNPVLVNLIQHVKQDPKLLCSLYNEHYQKSSSDYYYYVRELNIDTGLDGAANFLYLAKNAFSGKIRFNSRNRFNSPIRKNSTCPKLDIPALMILSETIQDMNITNRDYTEFSDVSNSLVYLDPPYFNNDNGHYNGVIDLQEFNHFLRSVEVVNKVVLSEQNKPTIFNLPNSYSVRSVHLRRSLQYITQNQSREIIAFNF